MLRRGFLKMLGSIVVGVTMSTPYRILTCEVLPEKIPVVVRRTIGPQFKRFIKRWKDAEYEPLMDNPPRYDYRRRLFKCFREFPVEDSSSQWGR